MEKSETAMGSKRKHWADVVRGICMTAILYDHTDICMTIRTSIIQTPTSCPTNCMSRMRLPPSSFCRDI